MVGFHKVYLELLQVLEILSMFDLHLEHSLYCLRELTVDGLVDFFVEALS